MIKATELRIGNWITTEISGNSKVIDVLCDSINTLTEEGVPIGFFDGIPLTEEILLKCGFERCTCGGWNIPDGIIFKMHLNKDFSFDTGIKTTSLHQLQNLFYALTGEELNVEL